MRRRGPGAGPTTGTTCAFRPAWRWSVRDAGLVDEERVLLGVFAVMLITPGLAAVARFHVGPQDHQAVAGAPRAQARDVLGRLEVLHLAVPESGVDEQRRVVVRAQVVIR